MSLLADLTMIAIRCFAGYKISAPEFELAYEVLEQARSREDGVPVNDFLKAYDVRMFNPRTGQRDIKLIKDSDFKGVYLLFNRTMMKCHIDVSTHVYKKVERHFRGYGNAEIFADYQAGDAFNVRFIRCDDMEMPELQKFGAQLRKAYYA